MSEPLRVVCFDLGGVLVRIHDGWPAACRHTGIAYDPVLDSEAFGVRIRAVLRAQQLGTVSASEAAVALSEASDGRYSATQFETLHASWLQGLYADAETLIGVLSAIDGLVTACLSNTDRAHWAQLSDWEPGTPYSALGELERAFASCQLGLAKPDPAIYEAVTAALDVPAATVLFFDDTPRNVEAARRHGWRAERIDPMRETVPQLRAFLRAHGVLG